MAQGFFLDVLEVESVNEKQVKDQNYSVFYARLRLAGGTINIRVKDGLKVIPGWSGKCTGSVRLMILKREYQGRYNDVSVFVPFELETWVPLAEVKQSSSNSIDSFLGKK